jgi:Asp-tRNA(Asn)/Glu-tRNA(Gln) amidotransferase A subunit family amidase
MDTQRTSLAELSEAMRSNALDVHDHLAELQAAHDRREPAIHALLPESNRFDRLHAETDALYARYPEPASRPPLFGIPVGVKDIIRTSGFQITAGSTLPPELFAGPEAECVQRLRAAGALILGITIATEFAGYAPPPTLNPHDANRTPGGSSSGSAAAVAAGYCPLALASQTGGSVIRPAAFCGIYGFKPSYDRIPIAGVIPFAESLDTVGFYLDQLAGMSLVASVLCDDWQSAAAAAPVFGIPEGPYLESAESATIARFRETCERIAAAGHPVKSVDLLSDFEDIRQRHVDLMAGECLAVHRDWYKQYGDRYAPESVTVIERGRGIDEARLAAARADRLVVREAVHTVMAAAGVTAWLTPAAPGPAPDTSTTGSPVMNMIWTYTGFPALTMPISCDAATNMSLGLQVVGKFGKDEALVQACESLLPVLS